MRKLLILLLVLVSASAVAQPGKLILDRGLLQGPTLRDHWLFVGKGFKLPLYPDTTTANQWLPNDSTGLLIQLANGKVAHRVVIGGVNRWMFFTDTTTGGAGATNWGGIGGTLSNQVDLQNALNGKQNLITLGTSLQYFDGTLALRTFPTNVSTFNNDAGYYTNVYAFNSIGGNGTVGNKFQLVNDVAGPGVNQYYGTNGSGTKGWYALPTGGGGGGSGSVTSIATASPIVGGTITTTGTLGLDTLGSHPYAAATQYDLTLKEPLITAIRQPKYYWNGYKQFVPFSTDSIPEGTAKYYTDARARLAISGVSPIQYNNTNGQISIDTSRFSINDTVPIIHKGPGTWNIYGDLSKTPIDKTLAGIVGVIVRNRTDSGREVLLDTNYVKTLTNGGVGKVVNGYRMVDSASVHIGFQMRFTDGTYSDTLAFPYVAPSSGSGGGASYVVVNGTITSPGTTQAIAVFVDEYRFSLPVLSANCSLSLQITGSKTTQKAVIFNQNTNASFHYNINSADTQLFDRTGTAITQLSNSSTYVFDYRSFDGTHYIWYQE